ncbi:MAG: hypothetical protein HW418_3297, partial [Anaerolineales bacterium]|nr:hypothetical protein [Anaerolineales bacterium]
MTDNPRGDKPTRFVACVLLLAMINRCAAPVSGGRDRPTPAVAKVIEAALIATHTATPTGTALPSSMPQSTSTPFPTPIPSRARTT